MARGFSPAAAAQLRATFASPSSFQSSLMAAIEEDTSPTLAEARYPEPDPSPHPNPHPHPHPHPHPNPHPNLHPNPNPNPAHAYLLQLACWLLDVSAVPQHSLWGLTPSAGAASFEADAQALP